MKINHVLSRLALFSLGWSGLAASAELPAWVIEVPDSLETLLVADTSDATLYEYSFRDDGSFAVTEYYMSIGLRGAGKARAGDQKTPLGNYFIVDQLDTSRLDPKYGITAFPLDYPNAMDRLAGRTGDGIWLHGVPPGSERRPERDTDGCIALPNEKLATLAERLDLNATPIVVTQVMRYSTAEDKLDIRSRLLARLGVWRKAQASGDSIAYLALYASGFRYRGLDRDEWAAHRVMQLTQSPGTDIEISNLLILEDPEVPGLVMTRFDSSVTRAAGTVRLTKRLYWRRSADGGFLIVAEDNG